MASASQTNAIKEEVHEIGTPIATQFSNVVARANELVTKAGLKWGDPVDVRWESDPLNRYEVIYPTSKSEVELLGNREVLVTTNGLASFAPRD